jgi:chorismate-pyruvate lyase
MASVITPYNQVMQMPLRELLNVGSIDLSTLHSFCRVLLTTDGTLTEILEAYFLERIQLVKVSEVLLSTAHSIPILDVRPGDEIIERKILLQGAHSKINYVYAESTIVVNEIAIELRHDLLHSKTSIGRLWIEHKMETFKEMVDVCRENAGTTARFFGVDFETPILSRTYRVFSNRKPVIMITEKFPEHFTLV